MLGHSRQSPIVIDDDDDNGDTAQCYELSTGNSTRVWANHASMHNFETDVPPYGSWVQSDVGANYEPVTRLPRRSDGRADMESGRHHAQPQTGEFHAVEMGPLKVPFQSTAYSLKRKRSGEDVRDNNHQPWRAAVHADNPTTPIPAPPPSATEPYLNLSKAQRKKLRKRLRAKGEVAMVEAIVAAAAAPMPPAEAILGYSAQHHSMPLRYTPPLEHFTYRPSQTPALQLVPQVPNQLPIVNCALAPFSSQSLSSLGLGTVASTMKQVQHECPSHMYYPPVEHQPSSNGQTPQALIPQPSSTDIHGRNMFATNTRIVGGAVPPGSGHGLFPLAPDQYVPHDPTCTLIMEEIPKKFRTLDFVLQWCRDTGTEHDPAPLHIDVMRKLGKALIEFTLRNRAIRAFNSPKLVNNDGRGQISVYWYRPDSTEPPPPPHPVQPAQLVQAPSVIPSPLLHPIQPPRTIYLPPLIHDSRPVRYTGPAHPPREDMEEGEIDEDSERGSKRAESDSRWSPQCTSQTDGHDDQMPSTERTPKWTSQADEFNFQIYSAEHTQWTLDPHSTAWQSSRETSPQPPVENSPASPRQSETVNSIVMEESASTYHDVSHQDDPPPSPELLYPPLEAQDLAVADVLGNTSTLTEAGHVGSLSEQIDPLSSIDIDMELDSHCSSSPVIHKSPSHNVCVPLTSLEIFPVLDTPSEWRAVPEDGMDGSLLSLDVQIRDEAALREEAQEMEETEDSSGEKNRQRAPVLEIAPDVPQQVESRLSELRQRVLASKKGKVTLSAMHESISVTTASASGAPSVASFMTAPPSTPLSMFSDADVTTIPARSMTPSTPSISSSASTDSLFSGSSNNSTNTSAPSERSSSVPKSASFLDNLATAFLQDIIGTIKSTTVNPPKTTIGQVRLDSRIVLQNRQKRLEQHAAETRELMRQITSASTKAEKDRILALYREKERIFKAESEAAEAAMQRMVAATRTKTVPFTQWPQTRRDQMILSISDSEDDACDVDDDE